MGLTGVLILNIFLEDMDMDMDLNWDLNFEWGRGSLDRTDVKRYPGTIHIIFTVILTRSTFEHSSLLILPPLLYPHLSVHRISWLTASTNLASSPPVGTPARTNETCQRAAQRTMHNAKRIVDLPQVVHTEFVNKQVTGSAKDCIGRALTGPSGAAAIGNFLLRTLPHILMDSSNLATSTSSMP